MPGIRGRVFHLNVNCSDLDASRAFYRDQIGLVATVRTAPRHPQPGQAFGLEAAHWDAWIMAGAAGLEEVVLDVLEWKSPRPSHPAAAPGFERLRVGVDPGSSLGSRDVFDPDGIALEIVARDRPRVAGVVVGCADVEASSAFYRDVLGLERPAPSTFCDDRGPEVFSIELSPAAPHAPRVATDLGLYRLALLTDDLDRDYAALLTADVHPYSPPATLDMGPGLPELRALLFPDPDGTTFELIEQPPAPGPAARG